MSHDPLPDEAPPLPAVIRLGRCEIRRDTREVLLDGSPRPVRRRVFDLIVYLVQHRPRAVPHRELLLALWKRREASSSLLARAVMEARQALGDTAEQALHIVSVHGVGYRYVGVAEAAGPGGAAQRASAAAADDIGPQSSAWHGLIDLAREAGSENGRDEARPPSAPAHPRADVQASQVEQVRTMMARAAAAMQAGRLPEAARFCTGAMRIAKAEGHAALVAEVRMGTGALHVLAGNLDRAMGHLREAMAVFSQPGHEPRLARCLNWMSQALARAGDFEAALRNCRRSIQLGARHEGSGTSWAERADEVHFLVRIGDRSDALGEAARAQQCYLDALERSDGLLRDLSAPAQHPLWAGAMSQRALLLERLGRLQEAWQATQAYEAALAAMPPLPAPGCLGVQPLVQMQRARLLARLGRMTEAMAQARAALEGAAQVDLQVSDVDELYRGAAGIAERAGDLPSALQWQRACNQALVRMQRGRSASLAAVLAAEMNSDDLQAQNDALLARQQELLRETAELRRRLEALEDTLPISPGTGLVAPALLEAAFAPAHAHAQARGLPMCVGLLSLQNASDLRSLHGQAVVDGLWREVNEALGGQGDVALPAVDLGDGRVAFRVRDAGPARAQVLCRELVADLRRRFRRADVLALPPQWLCVSGDAAQQSSVQACVEQLLAA